MSDRDLYKYFETVEDFEELPTIRNLPRKTQRLKLDWNPNHKPKGIPQEVRQQLAEQTDLKDHFNFTYQASRHERRWIIDSLGDFYEGQWLDDVLRLIKGGKEAHVYQCQANPSVSGLQKPYIAAKVYRPRQFRNLRKDHIYREGRTDLDADGNLITEDGMLNAMRQRSAYGLELLHTSWIEHEFQALRTLQSAGADVPAPLARGNNSILMSYIGGDETPAPTLNTVDLEPQEARQLFQRLLHNIELMLAHKIVHGDLSAYNVLYWEGQITVIDFPQVIDPHINRNAYRIFVRDLTRLCEYFASQGVKSNPRKLAAQLWAKFGYHTSPEVHPALLDAEDAGDRRYWRKMSQG